MDSFRTFSPRRSPQVVLEPTGYAQVDQPPQTGREDTGSGGQGLCPAVKEGTRPVGGKGQGRPLRGSGRGFHRLGVQHEGPRGRAGLTGGREAAQVWEPQGMAGSVGRKPCPGGTSAARRAAVLGIACSWPRGPTGTRPPAPAPHRPRTCPAQQARLPRGREGPASVPDGLGYFGAQAD